MEEAVSAYREALNARTRERVPLQWAMTQTNLGDALLAFGERELGTGRLGCVSEGWDGPTRPLVRNSAQVHR
jgi:hypothetical protein